MNTPPTAMLTMNFADRAGLLTQYGISVVPIKPRSKDAFLKNWPDHATTDPKQVADWNEKNSSYNCAAVANDDFWFWDVDNPAVFEDLKKATGHYIGELDTLVVQSSGAKRHIYFRHDDCSRAMGNRNCDLNGKEAFSVRASKRYVVGPGSIHPETGQPYEIVHEPTFGELPVAPHWLTDWILHCVSQSQKANVADASEVILEGTRDDRLFDEACKLRDLRYPQSDVVEMLRVINRRCRPPLPDMVVQKKVESAFTREPRGGAVADEPSPKELTPVLQDGDKVKTKKVKWLWHPRIPFGKITLFCGNPDNGKSVCAANIAAICTNGGVFPHADEKVSPFKVLMMVGEDDIDDTVAPRLVAAGAEMSNVKFFDGVQLDERREIRLDEHMQVLEKVLDQNPEIRLVIIDPISNYLGGKSMNGEQDVRDVLIPLKHIAARTGVAVILVMHLNKKSDLEAINRVGGAMAFIGVARCSWLFARDASTEDGRVADTFTMVRLKNNLAKPSKGGLAYRIEEVPIMTDDGKTFAVRTVWGDESEKSANDVLNAAKNPAHRPAEQLPTAVMWLNQTLQNGAKTLDEIEDEGRARYGFSRSTIARARQEAHIITFASGKRQARDGKMRDCYSCRLPQSVTESMVSL